MVQKHWILVANASRARLLERTSLTQPLVELKDWLHPESRMAAHETERAPLGQSLAGRTGLAPRADLKHVQRSEFAHLLAQYLEEAVLNHQIGAVAVVASNPFLGELTAHLEAPVQKALCAKHALDLTSLSLTALDQRLHTEFRL